MTARNQIGASRIVVLMATLVLVGLAAVFVANRLRGGDKVNVKDALQRGAVEEAVRGLDRILRISPNDEESLYYRGVCQIELRNFDQGLRDLALLTGSERYRDLAWYRTVRGLLTANRIADAKAEVESASEWRASSALAHEAMGHFQFQRAGDAIEQAVKKISDAKGNRRGDQIRSTVTRLVYADSKIYARSMDNFQAMLVSRYEYDEGAQLGTIIERGHRHLLAAVTEFQKAAELARRPASELVPEAHFQLADIMIVRTRDADAETEWRAIIDMDLDRFAADILRQNQARFQRTLARGLLARARVEARDYEGGLELALGLPEVNGSRPREMEWVIAQAYSGLGNDEKALEIARKWLRVSQKFVEPNLIVGRYLFKQEDYDAALPHLELAKGSSNTSEAADLYVQCLLKLQRFDRATAVLESRLESRSSDWEAFLLKVQAMEGMGWVDDARTALTKALGGQFSRPGTEANRRLRSYMEEFIARHDLLPRDLNTAQVLSTEDPQNFDFGRRYLDLLLDAGSVEQAHRVADDLVERCPVEDDAHYGVMMSAGRAYERLGRHERSVSCLARAQKDRPWATEAHVAMARNQLALGNMGAAWRAIEKATLLAPDDVDLAYVRFNALEARGDRQQAIAEGAKLAEKGLRKFDFLVELGRLLLAEGAAPDALRVLSLVTDGELSTPDRAIEHALLTLAAGGEADAKERIREVIRTERFGTSRVLDIARRVDEIGRPDLVVEFLEPRVRSDVEIDPAAVEVLARAYRATGADESFLSMLARLRRQGRRDLAFAWAAEFTSNKGAVNETLSIVDAAITEQAISLKVLEIGVREAVAAGRLDQARAISRELRKLNNPEPLVLVRLKALILDAEGSYVEAVAELEQAIEKALPHQRGPLWTDLIDIHGRHRQIAALKKTAQAALSRQECPVYMAVRAARYILAAGDEGAMAAIDQGIALAPGEADGHLDRGLLLLAQGDAEGATASIKTAFELRRDGATAHALAMLCAMGNRRKELNDLLRTAKDVISPETEPMALFVWHLGRSETKEALAMLDRLSFPSWAERQSLGNLVSGTSGDPQKAEVLRTNLPTFILLMSSEQTVRIARNLAKKMEAELPEFARETKLLRARALMTDTASFNEGITIVAQLLDQSNMTDEAALSIYAESYVKSGRLDDLERLVRFILEAKGPSDGFLMDTAQLLMSAERYSDAAKLLYLCKVRDDRVLVAQARALFKSGLVDRAAAIMNGRQSREQRDFLYCQIVGESLSADPQRRREGYELLKEAVYRFPITDTDVHVSLARAAYRLGERAEGRKNIERFLASAPASARNVVIAFAVLNEIDQADIDTLAYLQDRRALLDPSGRFSMN